MVDDFKSRGGSPWGSPSGGGGNGSGRGPRPPDVEEIIKKIQEIINKILQAAEAYKKEVVAKAEGEASRFVAIYTEYAKAKVVTQERMYLETMEKVLADIDKVIIDKNSGSGVVPYLPLPELTKKSSN